jgi:hypothetical protein
VTHAVCSSTPSRPDPTRYARVQFCPLATLLSRAVPTPVDNSTVAKLVELLIGTWPSGPKGHIWTRVLASYDQPAAAHQTWRNLARTEDRITVASYTAEYRRLTTTAAITLGGCDRCDGHGWRTIHEEHHSHIYETATPCTCPAGQAHTDTHSRIVSDNERELNRIVPGRITRPEQETLDANL